MDLHRLFIRCNEKDILSSCRGKLYRV